MQSAAVGFGLLGVVGLVMSLALLVRGRPWPGFLGYRLRNHGPISIRLVAAASVMASVGFIVLGTGLGLPSVTLAVAGGSLSIAGVVFQLAISLLVAVQGNGLFPSTKTDRGEGEPLR